MATPLDAEGNVDHAALVRHGLSLMEQGCDGLVPFGTTGEGPSFSAGERLGATEALLKAGIPAPSIGLGTGFPAIPDTMELARQAMALGLTHMLVLPPYYFRTGPTRGWKRRFPALWRRRFQPVAGDAVSHPLGLGRGGAAGGAWTAAGAVRRGDRGGEGQRRGFFCV